MTEEIFDMAGEPKPVWTTVCDVRPKPNLRILARHWHYNDGRAGYYIDTFRDGEMTSMRPYKFLSEVREALAAEGVEL